jgi:hypothetical protein
MDWRTLLAAVVCLLGAACGETEVVAPPRPASVPTAAVWAGGADGGAWLDCVAVQRAHSRYRCTVYNDYGGSVWADGEYVLRSVRWDDQKKKALFGAVNEAPTVLQYSSFDGDIIRLVQPLALVPDGWINYPFEKGGKKQLFELGEPRSEEVQYE